MPNNLVFNTVASELKTQIYGANGSIVAAIQLDGSNNVLVAGTVTIGNTVTVQGTVTVGNSVTVANTVTVQGTVTVGNSVTVANTVTVQGNVSATVNAVSFTTNNVAPIAGSGTVPTLTLDVSQLMNYVYYVKNNDATNSISVKIQVSPTNVDSYFVDDLSSVTTIPNSSAAVIVPKYYLNWARLVYDTGGNTANLEAYINARL